MLMQNAFGHNINGHDYFRPTGAEAIGMGLAAALPFDLRVKLGVAAFSWAAGRIENHFDS
ncbi:MAG TPA: hypothetical protein V6C86_22400 [Oculatellaceae cyanobacterium]|jgi:hypothetical protein